MFTSRTRGRRRALALGVAALLAVAGAACAPGPGPGTPGSTTTTRPPAGGRLYRSPDTQAQRWVEQNPNDPRTAVIRDRIANRPQARWLTDADPATVAGEVHEYIDPAVASGTVPVLVAYAIPFRDCGGHSSGGAAEITEYRQWIDGLAGALGSSRTIVLLEPDALAAEDCLSAARRTERRQAIAYAVRTIRRDAPNAQVYLDAGHSNWQSPSAQAERLIAAGVRESSGVVTNVSNYRTTADEVAYGRELLAAIGGTGLRQVIDTSRNGNGPNGDQWCDPPGRAVGQAPTLATGEPTVAAYLWVKLPGEADGCAAGAGQFVPDLAHALATN
jgi:endoglucanase